jgi:NADPH:quinone reductase-like Zn-dependent oxidoreductase
MPDMKAVVIHEAGGPDVLKIESLPIPTPKQGELLIRVKAFGLNRSELFTRQGIRQTSSFRVCWASRPSESWRMPPAMR